MNVIQFSLMDGVLLTCFEAVILQSHCWRVVDNSLVATLAVNLENVRSELHENCKQLTAE